VIKNLPILIALILISPTLRAAQDEAAARYLPIHVHVAPDVSKLQGYQLTLEAMFVHPDTEETFATEAVEVLPAYIPDSGT
jgi:carbonic anhydrase